MSSLENSAHNDREHGDFLDPNLVGLSKEFEAYCHAYLGLFIYDIKDKILRMCYTEEEKIVHMEALIHSYIDHTHIEMLLTHFQFSPYYIHQLLNHPQIDKRALQQVIYQAALYEDTFLFQNVLDHPLFTEMHALHMLEEQTLSSKHLALLLRHQHSHFFAVAMCIGALHPLSKRTYKALKKNPHFGQTMLEYIKDNPNVSTTAFRQVIRDITSSTKKKNAQELYNKRITKKIT